MSRREKLKKKYKKRSDAFDPEDYQEIAQRLLLKATMPEIPSSYLLEQLRMMDPESDLPKKVRPSDLDPLSVPDRQKTVWMMVEQILLGIQQRQGILETYTEEQLLFLEIIEWETYAKEFGIKNVIKPLRGLSATTWKMSLMFAGALELTMRAVARRSNNGMELDCRPELARALFGELDLFLNIKHLDDIPTAKKAEEFLAAGEEPSPTMMLLIIRTAMRLHLSARHPDEEQAMIVKWVKGISVPMFMLLFNSSLYKYWKNLIAGRPQTRVVDFEDGGFTYEPTGDEK